MYSVNGGYPHLGEGHEMQNQSSAERLLCRRRLYQADVQHCSPPALSNASSGFVLFKSLFCIYGQGFWMWSDYSWQNCHAKVARLRSRTREEGAETRAPCN